MSILLSLALLFHLIGSISTDPEVCNPIECFNVLDTFFQPCFSEGNCGCERITKLDLCIRTCMPNKNENFFLKGIQEVKKDLCFLRGFELENKCESKHKSRLLACIYEKFNMEAEDPNANKTLLMCRQALDGQYCDVDSLPLCSSRGRYLSQVLLVKLFDPLHKKNCDSFSFLDTEQLILKKMLPMKDYYNLADCLDENSPNVTDCVPQKWISTNVQDKSMLCSAVQSFLSCVERVLDSKCSNLKSVFVSVQQPLFSYMLPHCSTQQSNALPPELSNVLDNNLNEVYSTEIITSSEGVTTRSPQNTSEVRVLHQHDVITVNHQTKNGANQICINHYLKMIFLFAISKTKKQYFSSVL